MALSHTDIIKSFRQGTVDLASGGNCASIGLIKAAIEVFGVNQVFQLTQETGTYQVTFKNNTSVSFTERELQRTVEAAGFIAQQAEDPMKQPLYDSIFAYAKLCFCAMVKHTMLIGEAGDGKGNFEEALTALNDGAYSPNIHRLLGLEEHARGPKTLMSATGGGMIGWLKAHTVYISHGQFDYYGSPHKLGLRYPRRMQLLNS